ncbi:hypothetical protein PIB30_074548 [Stylosanthes scabra]|uniref:PGG domain-containing protein n=1 Tax=Stylosanthes scabra TaxID=79078 RepID=A0ABU6RPJ6_9FABA|nr:hypothetical protein [Stylosanthes scabra]
MRLKPSFGSKLNEQGLSPIHIALQNNHHNVVRRLVQINKELVRVRGRESVTPLHYVCGSGESEENMTLLIDLLKACPDSIEDVNIRNETALHIALKNRNMRVFRVLLGWLRFIPRKDAPSLVPPILNWRDSGGNDAASSFRHSILNWKDSRGNTILHIATLHNDRQAVDLLVKMVYINAMNFDNQTALDIAEAPNMEMIKATLLKARAKRGASVDDTSYREDVIKRTLSPLIYFITKIQRIPDQISEEQRNACMVVATLVVTAIYQTVLSPPGGLTQAQGGSDNGPNSNNLQNATSSLNSTLTTAAGKTVMSNKVFAVVKSLNGGIFVCGVFIIYVLMPKYYVSPFAYLLLVLFIASYFVSQSVISP